MTDIVEILRRPTGPIKVPDDLQRAADEIERLRAALRCEAESGTCVMVHDPERGPCTAENCRAIRALEQSSRQEG